MYVCLAACHLRGFLKGQLLAATRIDGMYPIAFVVCEVKNKDSWSWFLELLLADIGPVRERGWTFISDQQKVCNYLCKFNLTICCIIFDLK